MSTELGSSVFDVQTHTAAPLDGHVLYVGFNAGEWGGRLQRVDLTTGAVHAIALGPADPVTGVIHDPVDRRCVLVSIGLVHLVLSRGRILRVCGDQVAVRFEKPAVVELQGTQGRTEAIFGLAAVRGGYWAITGHALYRFGDDTLREYPLPRLGYAAGVWLSRELTGVVVVGTGVNWGVSTSGPTPLVVALEE